MQNPPDLRGGARRLVLGFFEYADLVARFGVRCL
jgi:hypothetical protein